MTWKIGFWASLRRWRLAGLRLCGLEENASAVPRKKKTLRLIAKLNATTSRFNRCRSLKLTRSGRRKRASLSKRKSGGLERVPSQPGKRGLSQERPFATRRAQPRGSGRAG